MSLSTPTGAEIKAFRKDHGLTQQGLADVLGVAKRTVEGWEGDAPQAPRYLAMALAYLRGRIGEMQKPVSIATASAKPVRTANGNSKIAGALQDAIDGRVTTKTLNIQIGPVQRKPGEMQKTPKR